MASSDKGAFAGRCVCGSIKYEFKPLEGADLPQQSLCHCNYCKRMTGACFTRNIHVPLPSITIISGEPKKFTQLKDAPRATFYFCAECGTQLYAVHDASPGYGVVRVGSLDRQAEFTNVGMQLNCENESAWLRDALQQEEGRFPGFPPMSSMLK
ncbi:hypothetical protein K432DRAFT_340021 [Lepidopterella palustris CBS 459.81]|uniref:CENP-V/GFA domain-containing protein n=1 Tax=Lepidopterella palustris CBS 459.81 TaxID=1314670 RepID=A0A8E2DXN9_9PEZI|nr:hypothetical protein K432DRAFT_340021 [Lepidopterella palustris CBS 459.81]